MDFDYIVVGRGLIGTAAARHLSHRGHRVALIGPSEPACRHRHRGPFGSHYDEGRITRIPCLTTHTTTGYPYVQRLPEGICLAIGGNGYGGRVLAARLCDGDQDDPLAAALQMDSRTAAARLPWRLAPQHFHPSFAWLAGISPAELQCCPAQFGGILRSAPPGRTPKHNLPQLPGIATASPPD